MIENIKSKLQSFLLLSKKQPEFMRSYEMNTNLVEGNQVYIAEGQSQMIVIRNTVENQHEMKI